MDQEETKWDKKLKIKTGGRDASQEDENHYPYEPTPYSVLERIAESEYLSKDNCVIDYGCGKGRVDFYLSYKLGCETIGIEFDKDMYMAAEENLAACHYPGKTSFCLTDARDYDVKESADCFYFFNPFSIKILQSVIGKIKESWYENPRDMKLFFYYPSDDYVSYLMSEEELCFLDELDCRDLFDGNNHRERILIFEVV